MKLFQSMKSSCTKARFPKRGVHLSVICCATVQSGFQTTRRDAKNIKNREKAARHPTEANECIWEASNRKSGRERARMQHKLGFRLKNTFQLRWYTIPIEKCACVCAFVQLKNMFLCQQQTWKTVITTCVQMLHTELSHWATILRDVQDSTQRMSKQPKSVGHKHHPMGEKKEWPDACWSRVYVDVWTNACTLTWKAAWSRCRLIESGIALFPVENVRLYICMCVDILSPVEAARGPIVAATSVSIQLNIHTHIYGTHLLWNYAVIYNIHICMYVGFLLCACILPLPWWWTFTSMYSSEKASVENIYKHTLCVKREY